MKLKFLILRTKFETSTWIHYHWLFFSKSFHCIYFFFWLTRYLKFQLHDFKGRRWKTPAWSKLDPISVWRRQLPASERQHSRSYHYRWDCAVLHLPHWLLQHECRIVINRSTFTFSSMPYGFLEINICYAYCGFPFLANTLMMFCWLYIWCILSIR